MVRKRKRPAAGAAGDDDTAGAATAAPAAAAAPAPKAAKKAPAAAANNKPNEQAKPPAIAAAAKKKPDEGKPAVAAAAAADASSGRAIFVSGIPYSATEDDLRGVFSKAGKITYGPAHHALWRSLPSSRRPSEPRTMAGGGRRVHMPRYHDSGKPRGYAIIDFATPAQAQKALELHGTVLQNRYLDVALSSSREGPGAAPGTPGEPGPAGVRPACADAGTVVAAAAAAAAAADACSTEAAELGAVVRAVHQERAVRRGGQRA